MYNYLQNRLTGPLQVLNITFPIPPDPPVDKLQPVTIVAIVIGLVFFILVIMFIIGVFVFVRRAKNRNRLSRQFFADNIRLEKITLGTAAKSIVQYDQLKNLENIGAGAFGIVYKAKWRELTVRNLYSSKEFFL
jgi:hypothetical protein